MPLTLQQPAPSTWPLEAEFTASTAAAGEHVLFVERGAALVILDGRLARRIDQGHALVVGADVRFRVAPDGDTPLDLVHLVR